MALRIYRSPNGLTFQFEEGKAPEGYVLVEPRPKAAPKRRAAANKAAKTDNK
jgi:hypothetical protein